MSAGCGKTPTIPSSMYNNGSTIAITAANRQRRYILNVPTNYDNTKPYKLIIAWHQLDGNDKQMYANGYYHLLNLSRTARSSWRPTGQRMARPARGLETGTAGADGPTRAIQDLALGDAVVAQIEENFCVDTNGSSRTVGATGAAMSYQHACARPLGGDARFLRAVAAYSGSASAHLRPLPAHQAGRLLRAPRRQR